MFELEDEEPDPDGISIHVPEFDEVDLHRDDQITWLDHMEQVVSGNPYYTSDRQIRNTMRVANAMYVEIKRGSNHVREVKCSNAL